MEAYSADVEAKMKRLFGWLSEKDRRRYATGRKYAEGFKDTMKILFDDHLSKWNYRALPQPQ